MDYGIILPHFSAFAHENPAERILTAATTAEALGYGTLWVLSLIHISEPTRLLSISYAVFCLKKKI